MPSVESGRQDSIARILLLGASGRAFMLGLLFSCGGIVGLARALFVDGEGPTGLLAAVVLMTGVAMEVFVLSELKKRRRSPR